MKKINFVSNLCTNSIGGVFVSEYQEFSTMFSFTIAIFVIFPVTCLIGFPLDPQTTTGVPLDSDPEKKSETTAPGETPEQSEVATGGTTVTSTSLLSNGSNVENQQQVGTNSEHRTDALEFNPEKRPENGASFMDLIPSVLSSVGIPFAVGPSPRILPSQDAYIGMQSIFGTNKNTPFIVPEL